MFAEIKLLLELQYCQKLIIKIIDRKLKEVQKDKMRQIGVKETQRKAKWWTEGKIGTLMSFTLHKGLHPSSEKFTTALQHFYGDMNEDFFTEKAKFLRKKRKR